MTDLPNQRLLFVSLLGGAALLCSLSSMAQTVENRPGAGGHPLVPTTCPDLPSQEQAGLQMLLNPDTSDVVKMQYLASLGSGRPVESVCLLLAALSQPDLLSAQILSAVQLALVDTYASYMSLVIAVIDSGKIDPINATALLARSARRFPESLGPPLRTSSSACKPLAMGLASSGHPASGDVMMQSFASASTPCQAALIESACPVLAKACPLLVFEAARSNRPEVRLAAVDGWRRLANPDALLPERMCLLLNDSSPVVVLALLESLAMFGARGCEDGLITLYERSAPAVREAVLPALSAGDRQIAVEFFSKVMESEDPGSRLHTLARTLLRAMPEQRD